MKHKIFTIAIIATLLISSCTSVHKTMREPSVRLELELDDLALSDQVSATATSTKIVGIDWERLFNQETASVQGSTSALIDMASIPVLGNVALDLTSNYALYELMMDNPNYDVVMYPQYETTIERPVLGIAFLMKKTTVKVTARLGKLKSE